MKLLKIKLLILILACFFSQAIASAPQNLLQITDTSVPSSVVPQRHSCLWNSVDFDFFMETMSESKDILKGKSAFVELDQNSHVMIVGDLHGDFISFLAIVNQFNKFIGTLPEKDRKKAHLIFLGDLVDRGPNSINIIRNIAQLIIENPENIIVLRGNHEWDSSLNERYGFKAECQAYYDAGKPDAPLYSLIEEFFQYLPICAKIGNCYLMHGFVPHHETKNEFILPKKIIGELKLPIDPRALSPTQRNFIEQVLWNDLHEGALRHKEGRFQGTFSFSESYVNDFFRKRGITIIRGHQIIAPEPDRNVFTIFSSYFNYQLEKFKENDGRISIKRYSTTPFFKTPIAYLATIAPQNKVTPIHLEEFELIEALDGISDYLNKREVERILQAFCCAQEKYKPSEEFLIFRHKIEEKTKVADSSPTEPVPTSSTDSE